MIWAQGPRVMVGVQVEHGEQNRAKAVEEGEREMRLAEKEEVCSMRVPKGMFHVVTEVMVTVQDSL